MAAMNSIATWDIWILVVYLCFPMLLGYGFRKERSAVWLAVILMGGLYINSLPIVQARVLPYIDLSVLYMPLAAMFLFRGRRANLFCLALALYGVGMTWAHLIDNILLVCWKSAYADLSAMDKNLVLFAEEVVAILLLWGLAKCTRHRRKAMHEVADRINPLVWLGFTVLSFYALINWNDTSGTDTDAVLYLQGVSYIRNCVMVLITDTALLATIIIVYQKKRLKQEAVLKDHCIAAQTEQYAHMGRADQETRKFRHDFNRHIEVLTDLYEKGETAALGEYLHQLNKIRARAFYISTGDLVCDAIFNQYYQICREDGMDLRVSGHFPGDMTVPATDLCVLLSNALDNACEATRRCAERREIRCTIGNQRQWIFITIHNPTDVPLVLQNGVAETTKPDGSEHGYGMANMQEAAGHCGGDVTWDYDGQTRTVTTRIRLRNAE